MLAYEYIIYRSLGWRARYVMSIDPINRDLDVNHPVFVAPATKNVFQRLWLETGGGSKNNKKQPKKKKRASKGKEEEETTDDNNDNKPKEETFLLERIPQHKLFFR